jgi:16S rRNA (guanine527-N7)-methyltransferase
MNFWAKNSSKMYELKKILSHVGIKINDKQNEQFQKYVDLILTWNKRTNLISQNDESRIIENHVLESLSFLLSFEIFPGSEIVDIGSGAGFPALPISLIYSDVNFLLVESKRMKALFLKEVISLLKLENVAVLCDRIECLSQNKKYEDQFDFAFSRAVASLDVVYGWVEKLLKPDGFYIAWKGGNVKEEIEKLQKNFKDICTDVIKMDERLVHSDKQRVFVRVQRRALNRRGET